MPRTPPRKARPAAKPRTQDAGPALPPEIEQLVQQGTLEAAQQLAAIAEGTDRETAKAARRALYTLRQAGVVVETTAVTTTSATEPELPVRALATNVAGDGKQMLLFVQEDRFGGSPFLATFLIHFGDGLIDGGGNKVPRRDLESSLDSLRSKESSLLVEMPTDYARHLLQEAADRTRAVGRVIPKGFSELRKHVGRSVQTFERPLIYETLSPEAVAADESIPKDPQTLFESIHFRAWLLSIEETLPWEEKYWESVQTSLALDHAQRLQLGEKIVDEATEALFLGDARTELRRRLEAQALVLQLAGETALASQALWHALSLTEGQPPSQNPFLRHYMLRSIHLVMALKAEAEEVEEPPEAEPQPTIELA